MKKMKEGIYMRNNGKGGGMCSAVDHASITCPLCNKPAFKLERGEVDAYHHFTNKGETQHIIDMNGTWSRKRVTY